MSSIPPIGFDIEAIQKFIEEEDKKREPFYEQFAEDNQKRHDAILNTAKALIQMNAKMDKADAQANLDRKSNRVFAIITITIGLLTLVSAVLLGILGLMR